MLRAHRLLILALAGAAPALGQGPLTLPTAQANPAAPPAVVADPAAGGHGGAAPEIREPDLAELLLRARTASPLLAAIRARAEARREQDPVGEAGREPLADDPLVQERRAGVAVSRLFGRIYEIDQELEIHNAGSELLSLLEETAASRYVAGETGQEEMVRARLEALHASGRRIELESRRAELVADLNLQVGLPATTPLGRISRLPAQLPPPRSANFDARSNAPLLLAARARLRAAESRKVPDDSQTAEIEAARAERRAAEAQVDTEVARLQAAWDREDRLLTHTRDGLLPQSGLLFEATRSRYLSGRVSFPALVETLRMWLETRIEVARHETGRFLAASELEALVLPPSGPQP